MGLGLAHLRLTSQMRCSHFAGSVKFSVKGITLMSSQLFFRDSCLCFFERGSCWIFCCFR